MGTQNREVSAFIPHLVRVVLSTALILVSGAAQAATIMVTSTADVIADGDGCGLREAVINANNNDQSGSTDCQAGEAAPVVDQIVFAVATNGSAFVLSLAGAGENNALTGDLDLTEDVSIQGNGANGNTLVDGNASDRVFDIFAASRAAVSISRLGVTNGGAVTDGAGMRVSRGNVTLQDTRVFANRIISAGPAVLRGAGIMAFDSLTLERVAVESNQIQGSGTSGSSGGGIEANAGLSITDSLIDNNQIETVDTNASGAGLIYSDGGLGLTASIVNSVISNNTATSTGTGNTNGGGINHQSGSLQLTNVALVNNTANRGGGLVAFDAVEMRNSTVSGNAGGGLSVFSSSVMLNNVTITNNSGLPGLEGSSNTMLGNTIVAGNTRQDCFSIAGSIASNGYNLIGDNSGCAFGALPSDQVGDVAGGGAALDAMLAPLADNGGGFTIDNVAVAQSTHALLAGSPAIDAGDPNVPGAGGSCETDDQRGETRPADGDGDGAAACDIGAFELAAVAGGGGTPGASSGGGGGGGCTLGSPGGVDPLLSLLGLLAGMMLLRRRAAHANKSA